MTLRELLQQIEATEVSARLVGRNRFASGSTGRKAFNDLLLAAQTNLALVDTQEASDVVAILARLDDLTARIVRLEEGDPPPPPSLPPPPPPPGAAVFAAPSGRPGAAGTEVDPVPIVELGATMRAQSARIGRLRGGTYLDPLGDELPSGTSWDDPVLILPADGEPVTIMPLGRIFHATTSYLEYRGFTLNGSRVSKATEALGPECIKLDDAAHHIRFRNMELTGAWTQAWSSQQDGPAYHEIIGCRIHDTGRYVERTDGGNHGIYVTSQVLLVEVCDFWNLFSGLAVHAFGGSQSDVTVRRCTFTGVSGGVLYGDRMTAVLNVFRQGAGQTGFGLAPHVDTADALLAHNVFDGQDIPITIPTRAKRARCLNNIGYRTRDTFASGIEALDATVAGNYEGDPAFVAPDGGDYHLTPTSPARGIGVDVPEVPTDASGTPWGAPRNAGLYA